MPQTINVIVAVLGCASVGAFIDFYIGKQGQLRVKERLEQLWFKFAFVEPRNFAERESHVCIYVLDWCFGPRFLSWRRWAVSLVLVLLGVAGCALAWFLTSDDPVNGILNSRTFEYLFGTVLLLCVGFALSISFTRIVCVLVIRWCRDKGAHWNGAVFAALLVLHYLILAYWAKVTRQAAIVIDVMTGQPGKIFTDGFAEWFSELGILWSRVIAQPMEWIAGVMANVTGQDADLCISPSCVWWEITTSFSSAADVASAGIPAYTVQNVIAQLLSLTANLSRLLLAVMFVILWLVFPVVKRPIETLWSRILESEKPVFTLTFTGLAALAGLAKEVAKHVA